MHHQWTMNSSLPCHLLLQQVLTTMGSKQSPVPSTSTGTMSTSLTGSSESPVHPPSTGKTVTTPGSSKSPVPWFGGIHYLGVVYNVGWKVQYFILNTGNYYPAPISQQLSQHTHKSTVADISLIFLCTFKIFESWHTYMLKTLHSKIQRIWSSIGGVLFFNFCNTLSSLPTLAEAEFMWSRRVNHVLFSVVRAATGPIECPLLTLNWLAVTTCDWGPVDQDHLGLPVLGSNLDMWLRTPDASS